MYRDKEAEIMDYSKIKKLVECEIDKISAIPEMNDTSLAHLDKLVDIIKDIDEIEGREMSIDGYSQRTMYGYYDDGVIPDGANSYRNGMSYRNYRGGNSYRGNRMYNNGSSYTGMRGYSMHGGKDELMDHLEMAMNSAQSEQERQAIKELMNEMSNM